MPNAPKTPTRTIRVSDSLWKAVQTKAASEGITVTKVIVDSLEAYVADFELTPEPEPIKVYNPVTPLPYRPPRSE